VLARRALRPTAAIKPALARRRQTARGALLRGRADVRLDDVRVLDRDEHLAEDALKTGMISSPLSGERGGQSLILSGVGIEEVTMATMVPNRRSIFGINCVRCKDELIAPEKSEYRHGTHIRHLWYCSNCETSFESTGIYPSRGDDNGRYFPIKVVA
jgi:hypothetical protein